jgi:hypothetical protein
MSKLNGKVGELRFTIQVKRAETGKVEEYEMVGVIDHGDENTVEEEQPKQE